jgi:hypothetical protein
MHDAPDRSLFRNRPPPARPTAEKPIRKESPRGLVALTRRRGGPDDDLSQEGHVGHLLEAFRELAIAIVSEDPAVWMELIHDRAGDTSIMPTLAAEILREIHKLGPVSDLDPRTLDGLQIGLQIAARVEGLLRIKYEGPIANEMEYADHGRAAGKKKRENYRARDKALAKEFKRRRKIRDDIRAATIAAGKAAAVESDTELKKKIGSDPDVMKRLKMTKPLSPKGSVKAINKALAEEKASRAKK